MQCKLETYDIGCPRPGIGIKLFCAARHETTELCITHYFSIIPVKHFGGAPMYKT